MIVKFGDMYVSVEDWYPLRKKPVLCVRFDDENESYAVASFKDDKTAHWFCELMEERIGGAKNE